VKIIYDKPAFPIERSATKTIDRDFVSRSRLSDKAASSPRLSLILALIKLLIKTNTRESSARNQVRVRASCRHLHACASRGVQRRLRPVNRGLTYVLRGRRAGFHLVRGGGRAGYRADRINYRPVINPRADTLSARLAAGNLSRCRVFGFGKIEGNDSGTLHVRVLKLSRTLRRRTMKRNDRVTHSAGVAFKVAELFSRLTPRSYIITCVVRVSSRYRPSGLVVCNAIPYDRRKHTSRMRS